MNWFVESLIVLSTLIIILNVLANRQKKSWPTCGCGHASSWHSNDGGCKYYEHGSLNTDLTGTCPCPRTQTEAERKVG